MGTEDNLVPACCVAGSDNGSYGGEVPDMLG
jgi:hypothetical protein